MPPMAWYVVHTYSGFENKAKAALEERIRALGIAERFGEILVPTEQVVEFKGGVKRNVTRKFLPGYILVHMALDDYTWHVVKNTPKVTGFVGGARKPTPIPEVEVRRITNQMDTGEEVKVKPRLNFERNEEVRVVDGPFATMKGSVEEVNESRGKLRVMVSIFGRPTSVELDFTQVEKTA